MADKKQRKREMGKWGLWNFFASEEDIRVYLPELDLFNRSTLESYLSNYSVVFIKPDYGWGGQGIIKAWKTGNGYSFVRIRGKAISCETLDSLYMRINKFCMADKRYVIQQGIEVAEINQRPFDIRLMMMRENRKWQYIGMLAKVAGESSVITNVARGKGYVTDINYALKQSLELGNEQIEELKEEAKLLAYKTCYKFDEYKAYWQIGLDLAVDKYRILWMIEENTGPAQSLFAKLKDKSMYNKMRGLTALRVKRKQQMAKKK
ncbi:YheC/YheD family protein [Aneurinibacillus sp. Ricciae_BoGa-3]|uniref:YheC/YheD family protein n=1 Tax=Aneurinibacillus sp. Ricciae_BoGa-3 TaxID=3022697 RepID=UPI0023409BE8|nr:YheC/YheD family protein [Aneurinibacillus sp. Ricciae_BoGa-3]WCK55543.1 YheC/YheD family protein [Aneurinibacillus sp. Ricciae_BoGa-3]